CRNVLIYLRPEAQSRILALFHFSLVPNGTLLLGSAEAGNGLVLALFVVSGGLNVAYFWPIIYTAFFEGEEGDPKPVLEGPLGGARADGGDERTESRPPSAARADGGNSRWERRPWTGGETTWLLLGPILAASALVVAIGVAADWLFVLELARLAAENAGVSSP
ncbi:CheR family methyltransferase, partial [Natronococcus sp.]|uniref:CheR family methyltransferase n=1 Tax=Natronococcus sp. TaxID=35747 RepID=UPI003A4E6509